MVKTIIDNNSEAVGFLYSGSDDIVIDSVSNVKYTTILKINETKLD